MQKAQKLFQEYFMYSIPLMILAAIVLSKFVAVENIWTP